MKQIEIVRVLNMDDALKAHALMLCGRSFVLCVVWFYHQSNYVCMMLPCSRTPKQIFRGTTSEPGFGKGARWSVTQDVTHLTPIFQQASR